MTDQKSTQSENAIAQQTQEKFEFYLLSLVFTLLALSIQTAKFGTAITADALELAGWLSFIVSGIAGLWRMEWVPLIRIKLAQQQGFEGEIIKMKELQLQGQTELIVLENNSRQPISERIQNREDAINLLSPYISKLERKHYIKYYFHVYGLVLGILSVASARAYAPALSIYHSLCW
jgi:hypothetical protein